MSRLLTTRRAVVWSILGIVAVGVNSGLNCPPGDPGASPIVPEGNRPPRIVITSITTPSGNNIAQQGELVQIAFTGEDGEDTAIARVFASTSSNPTPAEEIPILSGFAVGPGVANGLAIWDTGQVPTDFYHIFAEIDDRTFDPFTGTGNPAVRVTSATGVIVVPPGTLPTNGAPTIIPKLPSIDVGLTHQDLLIVRFDVADPESDLDNITFRILLDRDRDPTNDSVQPPIVLTTFQLGAGFAPPNVLLEQEIQIVINLNQIPIRRETDAQGRPLPYNIRIEANDGTNVVNAYTSGALRLLASANGVVDLLGAGGRIAGATFQGFGGHPTIVSRGDRAGHAFARLGDLDGDGIDDFAIVAETASPFGSLGAGHVYAIYGRSRQVDPDLPNSAFFQGRFSGIQSLNTVGTWVDFPPNDPRFRNFFKIRGQSMPHSHEGQGNSPGTPSLGITSLVAMPDVTGDGRPEIIVGAPFTTNVLDAEDLDPCDECRFSEVTLTCLENHEVRSEGTGNAFSGSIDNIAVVGDDWLPFDPFVDTGFGFAPNVDVDLDNNERILSISSLIVRLSGNIDDDVPDDQPRPVTVEVLLESPCGPLRTRNFMTEDGGNFDEVDVVFNLLQPPPARPTEFPVGQGQSVPPSVYDGVFTVFIRVTTQPVEFSSIDVLINGIAAELNSTEYVGHYTDGMPPLFSNAPGCDTDEPGINPFAIKLLVSSAAYPGAEGPTCPPRNQQFNPFLTRFLGSLPQVLDILGLFSFGIFDQMLDGHDCESLATIPGMFLNLIGPTNDVFGGPYRSGIVYFAPSDDLLTTINLDDEDGIVQGIWNGDGCPVQPLGQFGQVLGGCLNDSIRGARLRGAWYNPNSIGSGLGGIEPGPYDPTSLFGYTVDVMPDINSIFGSSEVLISAPGGGATESISVDLTPQLAGAYFADTMPPTSMIADFDLGARFSRVQAASLHVRGRATNLARLRLTLNDPVSRIPIAGLDSTLLLWGGAAFVPPMQMPANPLRFGQFFGPPVMSGSDVCEDYEILFDLSIRLPVVEEHELSLILSNPIPALVEQLLSTGGGSLTLEILNDCTITGSSVEIDSAILNVVGVVGGWGYVWLIEGQDYANDELLSDLCNLAFIFTDGDVEGSALRPNSWPSTGCATDFDPPIRDFCYPQPLAYLTGEERGDAFGWARHAGDVNGDGVADFICGAPLSSNDPFNPDTDNCPCPPFFSVPPLPCGPFVEPAPLQNNGKVYLIYGEAVLQNGPPCRYERFEIRGSHDGDQFGRVQGPAGDMNGDGFDDVYFAAENYDAIGSIGGIQNRGVEAGFVGVLYGNPSLTGEITVHAEQVGTGNFKGVKFIGGSPGARLGGGLTARSNSLIFPVGGSTPNIRFEALAPIVEYSQHGVSSAGDFNLDGFDDLLITAPGQEWPAAKIEFIGPVTDGTTITINGRVFEFEISGGVTPGRTPVLITSTSPVAAQAAFLNVLETAANDENLNVTAITSRLDFPDPLPDIPTITFLARRTSSSTVWSISSSNSASIRVSTPTRQGVAYLVFGGPNLENKTFYLPDDMNRRVSGQRILKGIVFVSAYEKGTMDEAPLEAVAGIGDVDGDGFPDIIIGAPTADFINVLAPSQRRQSVGEAYLIYGNSFGLNNVNSP